MKVILNISLEVSVQNLKRCVRCLTLFRHPLKIETLSSFTLLYRGFLRKKIRASKSSYQDSSKKQTFRSLLSSFDESSLAAAAIQEQDEELYEDDDDTTTVTEAELPSFEVG